MKEEKKLQTSNQETYLYMRIAQDSFIYESQENDAYTTHFSGNFHVNHVITQLHDNFYR